MADLPDQWRIARSILTFRSQCRPLAPNAPESSFGTVADPDHDTTSDHYPHVFPELGQVPVVTAGDIPEAEQCHPRQILDSIRRSRDPRVKYAISRGEMYSSYPTRAYPAWTWRPYSGADGHFTHGHLSVLGIAIADDPRPWTITGGNMLTPAETDQLVKAFMAYRMKGQRLDGSSYDFPYEDVIKGIAQVGWEKILPVVEASAATLDSVAAALEGAGVGLDAAAAVRGVRRDLRTLLDAASAALADTPGPGSPADG